MDAKDLETLAARGETTNLEFRRSVTQLRSAGQTLSAFLNGAGGRVLIGVTSDGRVVGDYVSDGTMQQVAAVLGKIEPQGYVEIRRIRLATNLEALVLEASPGAETRPAVFEGKPFQRKGASTLPMSQAEYQRLLLERSNARQPRWESRTVAGRSLDSLDGEEVLRTARIAARELPELADAAVSEVLERWNLIIDGQLLNATQVLFGRDLLPDYPQCSGQLARFRGTTKSEFVAHTRVESHAFGLLEQAALFLKRHAPAIASADTGCVDRPPLPGAALRECLINAIIHRDYSREGCSLNVAVYDDRVEVWNPGTLPAGLDLDDLKRDHLAARRNPLVADVFSRRQLFQGWGCGTQAMTQLCVEAGLPEPLFLEEAGSFGVRFRAFPVPHTQSSTEALSEVQQQLLKKLGRGVERSLGDLLGALESPRSRRTVQDALAALRRRGFIELLGRGRGARYRAKRS